VGEQASELSDGIEQQDVVRIGTWHAAARPPQLRFIEQTRHGVEALRLPRRNDQTPAGELALRCDDEVLFGKMLVGGCAGRNPQRSIAIRVDEFERGGVTGDRRRGEIVFQIPTHLDQGRRRAGSFEALLHFSRLDEYPIAEPEHRREPRSVTLITRERAVRDAAVHDDQSAPDALSFAKQVRPDFRLKNHDDGGPHMTEHAPHAPDEIEGSVEDAVDESGEPFVGGFAPREGGRADEDRRVRGVLPDFRNQRNGGKHLAD
jgi:hypothetical protein